MSISPVRGHTGWSKVTDDNQKENFIYAFEYPNSKNSLVSIVPRKLLPTEYAMFAYGIVYRKKGKNHYCGTANNLTDAIIKANKKRKEIGEV